MCIRKCPTYKVNGVEVGLPYDNIYSAFMGQSTKVPDCYAYGEYAARLLKPTKYGELYAMKTACVMRACMFVFMLFFICTLVRTFIKFITLRNSKCKMRKLNLQCAQTAELQPGNRAYLSCKILRVMDWLDANILRRSTPPPRPFYCRCLMPVVCMTSSLLRTINKAVHFAFNGVAWLMVPPQRPALPSWSCTLRHCFIESLYEPFLCVRYLYRRLTSACRHLLQRMCRHQAQSQCKLKMEFVPSSLFDRFVPYHPVTQMKTCGRKK